MNSLAIRAVHDPALGEAKSLLIKAHSGRYVGDGEHSRYCAVLLFVERINFLLSHGAPLSKIHILANSLVWCILKFFTLAQSAEVGPEASPNRIEWQDSPA